MKSNTDIAAAISNAVQMIIKGISSIKSPPSLVVLAYQVHGAIFRSN